MAVKKVWHDEEIFGVELAGSGWGVVFAFPIAKLAEGASLARMMNEKVKETMATSGWAPVVPYDELKAVSKEGVAALREIVEPYFEARGVGA